MINTNRPDDADALEVSQRRKPAWLHLTGRQFTFLGGMVALVLVAVWVISLRPWEESVLDRYKPYVPTSVPTWLIQLEPGSDNPTSKLGTGLWHHQDWCTVSQALETSPDEIRTVVQQTRGRATFMAALVCVSLWQGAWELAVQTEGKTPVQVNGAPAWLWRLEPTAFVEDPNTIAGDEWLRGNSLRQAIADRFDTLPDAIGRAYLYVDAAGSRYGEYGRLSGPALALQWNQDKQHFLLIGEDRAPITQEVLLAMAGSLAPKEESVRPGG